MKPARRQIPVRSFLVAIISVCTAVVGLSKSPATPLTFDEARTQLAANAPSLKAAQARFESKKDARDSLKGLNYPEVGLEMRYFRYEHTINNNQAEFDYLKLNGHDVPLAALGNTLGLGPLNSFEARMSQTAFQPLATASWVLYSGGQITAAKRAAGAAAEQAGAQADAVREMLDLELVRVYFGQQLAARVLALRKDLLAGMREHLDNAIKLEKGGLITKGQRLQAQVAYDAAQRGCDTAEHALENARIGFSALLHTNETLAPTTQLFVIKKPLDSLASFVVGARERNPQVRAIDSLKRAAEQGVKAERARWMPKVLAFGSYNFNKNSETIIDTDWLAGVGVHWALFDKIDRRKSYSAAKHTVIEAGESAEHVRMMADAGARQAYDGLASALRQFNLLESNLESARENLRVQELSFKEGQGISTDVTNARIALTNVLVERAVAAFQFDLELAKLLHASGQMNQFSSYMNQAEVIVP